MQASTSPATTLYAMDYINHVILAGIFAAEPVHRIMGNGKPEVVVTLTTENSGAASNYRDQS